jgi:hypothetical protein
LTRELLAHQFYGLIFACSPHPIGTAQQHNQRTARKQKAKLELWIITLSKSEIVNVVAIGAFG